MKVAALRFGRRTNEYPRYLSASMCRSSFGAPIEPKMVLGGYPEDDSFIGYIQDTTALLITIPVNASSSLTHSAKQWESEFLRTVRISFSDFCCVFCFFISFSFFSFSSQWLVMIPVNLLCRYTACCIRGGKAWLPSGYSAPLQLLYNAVCTHDWTCDLYGERDPCHVCRMSVNNTLIWSGPDEPPLCMTTLCLMTQ